MRILANFFLPMWNLYLCIAQKNGTVAESMKWPPDFSQRNNTSEYTSRLLSVNLPALQIPISLPLICSSALLVDFSNDRMECLAHTNMKSVKSNMLLPAVEVNCQHLVDVVVIGAFDMVTTQDGPCGSVIYVQTIHNTN